MIRSNSVRAAVLGALALSTPFATLTAVPALAQAPVALNSFAPLVEDVQPAVVTVATRRAVETATAPQVPDGMREFFDRFGLPDPTDPQAPDGPVPPREGVGSGFIIASDGVIVTNNHVVEGAEEIRVILADGREFDAELVGRDDRVDLAVLRVEAEDLPTVRWGDSDTVRVGDWVLAIGNPLGLDGTVTAGIVSARGRDINSGPYDDYLQVDAAINRGNSGGPLFDLEGNVVGVNTAILSPSGGNIGLGFAIPAVQAQMIVEDLLEDGVVERGWIGVSIQPLTDEIAESLDLEGTDGALVAEVVEGSPAEAAGVRAGDVVLSFADTAVDELRDLTRAVAAWEVGEPAELGIWRQGEAETLRIVPELLETASAAAPEPVPAPAGAELPGLGLSLAPSEMGPTVAEVEAGSPAAQAGLRAGDLLVQVNQTDVDSVDAVEAAVAAAAEAGRDTLLVLIEREGARRFLTIDGGLS